MVSLRNLSFCSVLGPKSPTRCNDVNAPRTLLVAADGGAVDALAPLAPLLGSTLEDVRSDETADLGYWVGRIDATLAELVVVGTSDSIRGRRIESAARRAARMRRLPLAAIEDFPGNYYDVCEGEVDLVLAESPPARERLLARPNAQALRVEVASPARYDVYRAHLQELRATTRERWTLASKTHAGPAVLWAGQPETDDALATLHALLPALVSLGAELRFKAHPRDAGYATGRYRDLLNAPDVEDVTRLPTSTALAAAPALVVTQFSSLAIEAGFYGIPALFVLLPEAGGARLLKKKGYAVPPLCEAGAGALACTAAALAGALATMLGDEDYRARVLRCFDAYFEVAKISAPEVSEKLVRLVRESK